MLETILLYSLTWSQATKEVNDTSSSTPHLDPFLEVPTLRKIIPVHLDCYDFRRALPQPIANGKPFFIVNELHTMATGMSIMDVLRSFPE